MGSDEGPLDTVAQGMQSGSSQPRFLFPIDGEHVDEILPLVCDLVGDADGELLIAAFTTLPEQTPLPVPEPRREAERRLGNHVRRAKQECTAITTIRRASRIGRRRGRMLNGLVETYEISTVITEDQPRSGLKSLLGIDTVNEDTLAPDCDTIIVSRTAQTEDIDTVLVPVAGGPHSGMGIDTGLALARQNDASLELFHVYDSTDETAESKGEELLTHGMDRIDTFDNVERTLTGAEDLPQTVIEYTQPFDVTILGAPREGLIRQFVLGTIPDLVSTKTDGTVLITHRDGDHRILARTVVMSGSVTAHSADDFPTHKNAWAGTTGE